MYLLIDKDHILLIKDPYGRRIQEVFEVTTTYPEQLKKEIYADIPGLQNINRENQNLDILLSPRSAQGQSIPIQPPSTPSDHTPTSDEDDTPSQEEEIFDEEIISLE